MIHTHFNTIEALTSISGRTETFPSLSCDKRVCLVLSKRLWHPIHNSIFHREEEERLDRGWKRGLIESCHTINIHWPMNLYQMKLLHAIGKLRHSFIHTTRSIKSIVQSHLNFLTQLNSFHPENLMLLSFLSLTVFNSSILTDLHLPPTYSKRISHDARGNHDKRLLPFRSHNQLNRMLFAADRISLRLEMIHSHSWYRWNDSTETDSACWVEWKKCG